MKADGASGNALEKVAFLCCSHLQIMNALPFDGFGRKVFHLVLKENKLTVTSCPKVKFKDYLLLKGCKNVIENHRDIEILKPTESHKAKS